MADKTRIEWTDATWNPVTGCSKVSPGCAHCYAEELHRTRFDGQHGYPPFRPWTPDNAPENVVLRPDRLDQPLRWTKPRMVFVNSMSDLFHDRVEWRFVAEVFAVMSIAEQHTFQVLTKRPETMRNLLTWPMFWLHLNACRLRRGHSPLPGGMSDTWSSGDSTLPNVWLGTSIENRRFVDRADALRETPAAVRFISAEPLLGPLLPDADHMIDAEHLEYPLHDFPTHAVRPWADGYQGSGLNLDRIDWLIVGGESGPDHRPIEADWVRELRDYCEEWPWQPPEPEGETAFFFKQWGGRTPKANGRELDGRTWDEMPEVAR